MPTGLFDVLSLQGVTFPSTNISSEGTVGFEEKDGRDTLFLEITEATFDTEMFASLALGIGTPNITAALAKTLPGVTAAETLTVTCEMFADTVDATQGGVLQIKFFNESAVQKGSTIEIEVSEADTWEAKSKNIVVPADATRMNLYLVANCTTGETIKVWLANLKVKRT